MPQAPGLRPGFEVLNGVGKTVNVPKLIDMMVMAAALAAIAPAGAAQASVADFIRGQTSTRGHDLVAAARIMPADRYAFTPAPDQMTFAEFVLHVADGNYQFCSAIGGS